ncbi:hypothetical protein TREES_T100002856 [Tupaia chinensis]|uniref:Uncharacterized protein n=1 Tax=Tupaia chinensis TaxID=246437 RepID=L9KU43_TUPCH|nr:hypothetical protein TREES_T100002856 [Tupaia chinensis]
MGNRGNQRGTKGNTSFGAWRRESSPSIEALIQMHLFIKYKERFASSAQQRVSEAGKKESRCQNFSPFNSCVIFPEGLVGQHNAVNGKDFSSKASIMGDSILPREALVPNDS